jgi:hypothetical protein
MIAIWSQPLVVIDASREWSELFGIDERIGEVDRQTSDRDSAEDEVKHGQLRPAQRA